MLPYSPCTLFLMLGPLNEGHYCSWLGDQPGTQGALGSHPAPFALICWKILGSAFQRSLVGFLHLLTETWRDGESHALPSPRSGAAGPSPRSTAGTTGALGAGRSPFSKMPFVHRLVGLALYRVASDSDN